MRVVFIGDSPSKSNIDPDLAFVGTKSYKKLLEWIWHLDLSVNNIEMFNKDFAPIIEDGKYDKIIALGVNASKELDKYGVKHFKLPHPSGLNRLLNDKKYVDKIIVDCKNWLNKGDQNE